MWRLIILINARLTWYENLQTVLEAVLQLELGINVDRENILLRIYHLRDLSIG